MQYSLLSRFQGAKLGGLIGYLLSRNQEQVIESEYLRLWELESQISQSLIETGDIFSLPRELCLPSYRQSDSKMALVSLPLALFYHENWNLLEEKLKQFSNWAKLEPQTEANLWIWWRAIALILGEKLPIESGIEPIFNTTVKGNSVLAMQLKQISDFFSQGATLREVMTKLSQSAQQAETDLALAFYCFSAIPTDFRLCLGRAAQISQTNPTILPLTGILAGAYNSYGGIPAQERLWCRNHPLRYLEIEQLWAVWSGIYDPMQKEKLLGQAIAPPALIQPRASVKVISQRE